jgi:hypothetical protein
MADSVWFGRCAVELIGMSQDGKNGREAAELYAQGLSKLDDALALGLNEKR